MFGAAVSTGTKVIYCGGFHLLFAFCIEAITIFDIVISFYLVFSSKLLFCVLIHDLGLGFRNIRKF